jgi:hypothetical protein
VRLGLLALVASAGACQPLMTMRAPGLVLPVRRLAVMAPSVQIDEDTVSGSVYRPDWTAAGRRNVEQALRVWAADSGARYFDATDMVDINLPYEQFRKWSQETMLGIALRSEGHAFHERKSVTDWRFPRNLGSWQVRLEADYVLTVLFLDGHMSGGMAALTVLGAMAGGYMEFRQVGMACLVRLADGTVVWCERRFDQSGDLRMPPRAHAALKPLVQSVLRTDREIQWTLLPAAPKPPASPEPAPPPAGVSTP